MALTAGTRLGPYEINALIGKGGMGEVYRATDTRLGRTVAIKVLPVHVAMDADLRYRFELEARALAALSHPHICPVFDVGQQDGIDYLVMEYLEGESLAERLSRGHMPLDQVLRYALEIGDALVETHARGITHRDLKPSNIMVTKSGAKLLDFGVAKLKLSMLSPRETGGASTHTGSEVGEQTTSTAVAGTLAYMAPEQKTRGQDIDHRADVFAFGAVLYEMVTGDKAFDGESPTALLEHDLPRPFSSKLSETPPALDALIQKCLQKDPVARWQDTSAMADELRAIAAAVATGRTRRLLPRKQAAIVLSLLTLALLVGGTAAWRGGLVGGFARLVARDAEVPPAPLRLGNMRPLTGEDRLEIDPAISPDGSLIAYAAGTPTQVRIYVRSVNGGLATPLHEATTPQFQPRWSRDGTQLLYISPEGVFVTPFTGGNARQLVSRADVPERDLVVRMRSGISGAAWAPDGKRVAVADNSDKSLSLVSVDDGRRRVITTSQYELHSCDWSPDGKWIACTSGNWHFAGVGWTFGNAAPSAIVVVAATGGDLIEVTDRQAMNSSPVWAPDSMKLYFVSNQEGTSDVYSLEFGEDGRARGAATRITTGLGAYSIRFSADGERLAYVAYSARANIWSVPIPATGVVDASDAEPITRANQIIESMRVSRDGKWLLYDSNLNGSFDIFRTTINGGPAERLTMDPLDEFVPDLSPDGRYLAYHSWHTKSRDIFVQLLDGGPPEQVTATSSQEAFPVWSPDGQSLAFVDLSEDRGLFRGAFVTRRDGTGRWSAPVALRAGAWKVSWSPNGRFLAYSRGDAVEVVSPESRESRVVYVPAAHSTEPKAEDVLFGEDSETLYFKSHDAEGRASIWSVPLAGGSPRLLVKFADPARASSRTDFAIGGGRCFFTIDERRSNIWIADLTEH